MFRTGVTFSLGGVPQDERGRVCVHVSSPGRSSPWPFEGSLLKSCFHSALLRVSCLGWPAGLSPINYRGFGRCREEEHTSNLQVPLHLKVKQERLIYFWNLNWISPPAVSADLLESFKQRERHKGKPSRSMAAFGEAKHLEPVKKGQIK